MFVTKALGVRKILTTFPNDSYFKHDQIMRFAFIFRGRAARCFKLGIRGVTKALQHMKSLRSARRDFTKEIWVDRLNAACIEHGLPSSQILLEGLAQCNIALNKNMLQTLAIYEPKTFESLVTIAKQYHIEKGYDIPGVKVPENIVTRGLLQTPLVPGNRRYFD